MLVLIARDFELQAAQILRVAGPAPVLLVVAAGSGQEFFSISAGRIILGLVSGFSLSKDASRFQRRLHSRPRACATIPRIGAGGILGRLCQKH